MLMKYLADVLTFFRFPAAFAVFGLIMTEHWLAAMIVFALAILSDALDGIVARKWPPGDRWYRKDPHAFDNAGDSLLFFGALVGLAVKVQPLWLIILTVSIVGTLIILFFIAKLRPSRAEKLDVAFGWCFGALLVAMLCQITDLALPESDRLVVYLVYGVAIGVIVPNKWDRMTSRPEVTYKGTW